MLRIALLSLLLALPARSQGVPDDGLTDSTQALQNALDTGHLHLAGDPLGSGAQIAAIIANGAVANLRIDSPGTRYCVRPDLRIEGGATAIAEVDAKAAM